MTAINLPHPDRLFDDEGRANRIAARKHLARMAMDNPDRLDLLNREWLDAEGPSSNEAANAARHLASLNVVEG